MTTENYPDFVFISYEEDVSAQTRDVAVSLEPGSLVRTPVMYIRHDLKERVLHVNNPTSTCAVAHKQLS